VTSWVCAERLGLRCRGWVWLRPVQPG